MIASLVTVAVILALIVRNWLRLLAYAAVALVLISMLPGVSSRLGTLSSLGAPPSNGVVDQSLLGREAALKAGLAMFRDSPITGVGAGDFDLAGRSYQRELGLSALSLSNGQLLAPHDLYLQMLAESGSIGLIGWLIFYLGSLVLTWRTRRRWRRLNGHDSMEERLSSAVLASLVGWGVASIFLHLADLPILLVIVAFAASLHLRARDAYEALPQSLREPLRSAEIVHGSGAAGRHSAGQVAILTLTGLLFAAGAILGRVASDTTPGWSASAVVTMVPTPEAGSSVGYTYQVLSRSQMMPTFVELAAADRFLAQAADAVGASSADRQHLTLTTDRGPNEPKFRITVTVGSSNLAQPLLNAVIQRFHDFLADQRSLYNVQTLSNSGATRVGAATHIQRLLALLAGVLGLVTGLLAIWLRTRSRPRRSDGGPPTADRPRHRRIASLSAAATGGDRA
jgi:hypothetical protein